LARFKKTGRKLLAKNTGKGWILQVNEPSEKIIPPTYSETADIFAAAFKSVG